MSPPPPSRSSSLHKSYPWTSRTHPLIVSAPMMNISLARYALSTSAAGGLGFLAGGYDLSTLHKNLLAARSLLSSGVEYPHLDLHDDMLPIGVGVQNWGADLEVLLDALREYPVCAVWFFGPKDIKDLRVWGERVREVCPRTKVWVQVGSVAETVAVVDLVRPDVLVVQGADAGGHGLARRAGIVTLLPEVADALEAKGVSVPLIAAGGIMDARGAAAALCLGADGVCLGTRLLASKEAVVAQGYRDEVLRAQDGGVSTIGSKVYDQVRGIKGWPQEFSARGVINKSYIDAMGGMNEDENHRLYVEEVKKGDQGWGPEGRMTTYAGTGVGLVKSVKSIKEIIDEVHGALEVLGVTRSKWSDSAATNGTTSLVATD